MGFAENLKLFRKKAKITQQELADKLRLSRVMVASYEKGKSQPSTERLCEMASILNTTPNDLLGFGQKKDVDIHKVVEVQMQIIDTLIESLSDIREELKNAVQN